MLPNTKQKERIQTAIQSENFNLETEVENLISQGFTKEEAIIYIKAEIDFYKQKLFEQKLKKEGQLEYQKVAAGVSLAVSIIGPAFDITSIWWYIVACAIAGGCGYWAYRNIPIAGVVGSMCGVIIMPFTYFWYISGRTSIINIELVIPIALALIPSFLIGLILSKIIYPDN